MNDPYPQHAGQDERDLSPVDEARSRLDGAVAELDDVARALVKRLDLVLTPERIDVVPPTVAEVRSMQAPFVMALRDTTDRVVAIQARLVELMARLEV